VQARVLRAVLRPSFLMLTRCRIPASSSAQVHTPPAVRWPHLLMTPLAHWHTLSNSKLVLEVFTLSFSDDDSDDSDDHCVSNSL
jgi:hypothetical protein